MRIGISTLMVQRGKTGVAQYLFALLRGLEKQSAEHRFTLFVLEEDLSLFEFARPSMTIVPVPESHRPAVKNILWHQQQLPQLVREHNLQVLHIPSYRRLLWRRPCPLVATIHDLAPFRVPRKYDWKRMFYGRVVVRRLARRQDRVIAVSHNTAKDIVTFFGLPASRIEVIHNGIDHERFFPGSSQRAKVTIAQRYGLKQRFFLYVARLEHPGKNHTRLIAAFDLFKTTTGADWQLVFGGSDWHGAQVVHAAIAASKHRQDIRTLGFVPDSGLPELYQAADAFVYPSLYEGFGFPPLEAMACGCPVISSTGGSLGEIVGDAALTIDPEDIGGIAAQLRLVASRKGIRDHLGAKGLARAKSFDWTCAAARTLKVYQQAYGLWQGWGIRPTVGVGFHAIGPG